MMAPTARPPMTPAPTAQPRQLASAADGIAAATRAAAPLAAGAGHRIGGAVAVINHIARLRPVVARLGGGDGGAGDDGGAQDAEPDSAVVPAPGVGGGGNAQRSDGKSRSRCDREY